MFRDNLVRPLRIGSKKLNYQSSIDELKNKKLKNLFKADSGKKNVLFFTDFFKN